MDADDFSRAQAELPWHKPASLLPHPSDPASNCEVADAFEIHPGVTFTRTAAPRADVAIHPGHRGLADLAFLYEPAEDRTESSMTRRPGRRRDHVPPPSRWPASPGSSAGRPGDVATMRGACRDPAEPYDARGLSGSWPCVSGRSRVVQRAISICDWSGVGQSREARFQEACVVPEHEIGGEWRSWQRTCFGSTRSRVRVPPPRPSPSRARTRAQRVPSAPRREAVG